MSRSDKPSSTLNVLFTELLSFYQPSTLKYSFFLAILFLLVGVLGLQVQSAQVGVTPIWPASGVALAFFVIFGLGVWPGVLLGMFLLSFYAEVPISIAVIAGVAAIAESTIPLIIARKLGFSGRLHTFRDAMLFIAMVTLGPVISASAGVSSMYVFSEGLNIFWMNVMTLWWLGNSIGMLVFGGMMILFYQIVTECELDWNCRQVVELMLIVLASLLIAYAAFLRITDVFSALLINLLIPLVFFAGLRFKKVGALLPAAVVLSTMLILAPLIPSQLLEMESLNIFYLGLVEIWFIALTGFLMAAAFEDYQKHYKNAWLATHDLLTGLNNRVSFESKVAAIFSGSRRADITEKLLFIDLDQMKYVNDTAGHLNGDRLLMQVASALQKSIRDSDFVARWGGDEFSILLEGCSCEEARIIAHKVLEEIRSIEFSVKGESVTITASIGITDVRLDDTHDSLMERADNAVYTVKRTGKNNVLYADQCS